MGHNIPNDQHVSQKFPSNLKLLVTQDVQYTFKVKIKLYNIIQVLYLSFTVIELILIGNAHS